jgi:hypothetical protein
MEASVPRQGDAVSAPEPPIAAPGPNATPQETLAAVYDSGAAAYEQYWAPVLHRHAVHLVKAIPPAQPALR